MRKYKVPLTSAQKDAAYLAVFQTAQLDFDPEVYAQEFADALRSQDGFVEFTIEQLRATLNGLRLASEAAACALIAREYSETRQTLKRYLRDEHRLIC